MINNTDPTKRRNNSDLSYMDCMLRFGDDNRRFEDMSNDDLDSIYACVFGRWAYHLTRQAYIDCLNNARLKSKQE
jgi:hypothetical protein